MNTSSDNKRLFIVTGAGGVVGREYLEILSKDRNNLCIAMSRSKINNLPENVRAVNVDLLEAEDVKESLSNVALSEFSEIFFLHTVGKFKFEPDGLPLVDHDDDGIDDEVYSTNVNTFLNVVRALFPKINEQRTQGNNLKMTLCGLGSISDQYNVKYWSSYTKAKNKLRSIIYHHMRDNPANTRGLFINVSTVDTENENDLRPGADKTYWLKAREIVKYSLPLVENGKVGFWKELDIWKVSPRYHENYFEKLEEIKQRWDEARYVNTENRKNTEPLTEPEVEIKAVVREYELLDMFGSKFK